MIAARRIFLLIKAEINICAPLVKDNWLTFLGKKVSLNEKYSSIALQSAKHAATTKGVVRVNQLTRRLSISSPPNIGPAINPRFVASVMMPRLMVFFSGALMSIIAACAVAWLPARAPNNARPKISKYTQRHIMPNVQMDRPMQVPRRQIINTFLRPIWSDKSPSIGAPKNMQVGKIPIVIP